MTDEEALALFAYVCLPVGLSRSRRRLTPFGCCFWSSGSFTQRQIVQVVQRSAAWARKEGKKQQRKTLCSRIAFLFIAWVFRIHSRFNSTFLKRSFSLVFLTCHSSLDSKRTLSNTILTIMSRRSLRMCVFGASIEMENVILSSLKQKFVDWKSVFVNVYFQCSLLSNSSSFQSDICDFGHE